MTGHVDSWRLCLRIFDVKEIDGFNAAGSFKGALSRSLVLLHVTFLEHVTPTDLHARASSLRPAAMPAHAAPTGLARRKCERPSCIPAALIQYRGWTLVQ